MDSEEIIDDYMSSALLSAVHIRDFRDFHEEEKPKILELARLNKIVAPHGKEITKKDQS